MVKPKLLEKYNPDLTYSFDLCTQTNTQVCIITGAVLCSTQGNVTKSLQTLGMGVYDNENQPGVSKKITRI